MAKELTNSQRENLIEQFVDIVVDGMDMKTLVQYVTDDLIHFYENKCDDVELKEFIDNHDEELYDELVDNVTQQYPKQDVKQSLNQMQTFIPGFHD